MEESLDKLGKNVSEAKIEMPTWPLFLSQFKELFVIVLIIGGLIANSIQGYQGMYNMTCSGPNVVSSNATKIVVGT
ncbi:MAG: cation-transporting P-type ATPase [Candidatus Thermoplasmatota archaeon]